MAASSFLDKLTWLHCSMCETEFHRDQKMLLLECEDVICHQCATQMRSPTQPNRVFCQICKKTVKLCRIAENMPTNLRVLFMESNKTGYDMVRSHDFQLRLQTITNEKMRIQCERMDEFCERQLRVRDQYDNKATKNIADCDSMRKELLKVMSEERLQYLMSLDGDSVLTNMTASELTDGTNNGRRRQSADTDRIVSSTPYWNNPRQSTEDSTPYFTDARSNAQKGHGLAQSLVNGSSGSGNSHHSRGETSRRCDLYRRTSNERRLSGGNVLEEPRHRRHSRENRNSRERRPSDGYNNSGYHRTPRE